MKELIERAKDLLDRYADYEGYEDIGDTEMLLEDAMNLIADFKDKLKAE